MFQQKLVANSIMSYPQNQKIIMPYQVKLDVGQIIFAPQDKDEIIKEDTERLGEEVPDEVKYLMSGGSNFYSYLGQEILPRPLPTHIV